MSQSPLVSNIGRPRAPSKTPLPIPVSRFSKPSPPALKHNSAPALLNKPLPSLPSSSSRLSNTRSNLDLRPVNSTETRHGRAVTSTDRKKSQHHRQRRHSTIWKQCSYQSSDGMRFGPKLTISRDADRIILGVAPRGYIASNPTLKTNLNMEKPTQEKRPPEMQTDSPTCQDKSQREARHDEERAYDAHTPFSSPRVSVSDPAAAREGRCTLQLRASNDENTTHETPHNTNQTDGAADSSHDNSKDFHGSDPDPDTDAAARASQTAQTLLDRAAASRARGSSDDSGERMRTVLAAKVRSPLRPSPRLAQTGSIAASERQHPRGTAELTKTRRAQHILDAVIAAREAQVRAVRATQAVAAARASAAEARAACACALRVAGERAAVWD